MDEQWRPVLGYEGYYEVSDFGRVRSLDRIGAQGRRYQGTILAQMRGRTGYRQVNLHCSGQVTHLVHRLVLLAFAGPAPEGMEVRHRNGDRADNTLANLAWGTHLENMRDQREHGTHKNSVKTHCPAGHPYAGDNLKIEKSGTRRCTVCRRESSRRVNARRSAARKMVA